MQYLLMMKSLRTLKVERGFLNLINRTYKKPTVCIKLNRERLNTFPLKIGNKARVSTLTFLLDIVIVVVKKTKLLKGIQIGKEEVKLLLPTNDMILYLEALKKYTIKLVEVISLTKSADQKHIDGQYQLYIQFYILTV